MTEISPIVPLNNAHLSEVSAATVMWALTKIHEDVHVAAFESKSCGTWSKQISFAARKTAAECCLQVPTEDCKFICVSEFQFIYQSCQLRLEAVTWRQRTLHTSMVQFILHLFFCRLYHRKKCNVTCYTITWVIEI